MSAGSASVAAVLALSCAAACSAPEAGRVKATAHATCDRTTGHLIESGKLTLVETAPDAFGGFTGQVRAK